MAAAFLTHLAGEKVIVKSAGTAPKDSINPTVIEVMNEVGIDVLGLGATPKRLTDNMAKSSDVVITMGCGDTCPIFPGVRYEDWKIDDPAGQTIEVVREIRNSIKIRIESLIEELGIK